MKIFRDRATVIALVLVGCGTLLVMFGHDCAGSAAIGAAAGVASQYAEQG